MQTYSTIAMQSEILLVISVLTRNDTVRRPTLPIHLAKVARELLWHLERCEMSSRIVLRLEHEVADRVRPPEQR